MSGWRGSLVLAVLAGGVAGCSVVFPRAVTHYTPAPATLQDRVNCLVASRSIPGGPFTGPESKLMGTVPPGFVPVDVVRCMPGPVRVSGSGQPTGRIITEEHLSGDYTALLTALAEPSDRQEAMNCTSQGEDLPELWLVNAEGRAVHVMWPLNTCDRSKPDAHRALAELRVTTTVTHPASGAT